MRVGLLCSQDWANFAYGLYKSLQAVNVDVIGHKLGRHLFGYLEQLDVITPSQVKDIYKDCNLILLVHSDWELIELLPEGSNVINFATGTKYRSNPEFINTKFNSPFTLIALPEFQTPAPNPKYLVGAIELDMPVKPVGERLVVGHFPSNYNVKGTDDINRIILQLKDSYDFEYLHSVERVSHQENLERMNQCDIYIELIAPTQGGKPYGSFGISALEAAALGKIVVTQDLNGNGLYGKTYGPSMLNFVKDEMGLKKTLSELLQYKGSHIEGQQKATKDWVNKYHSHKATGEKLMSYLNGL